jgi:hypothetical protein
VADINIDTKFTIVNLGKLIPLLAISYGFLVALVCLIFFSIFRFLFGQKKISVVSPSFLSISLSLLAFLFLLVFRKNYSYFLSFFDSPMKAIWRNQTWILLCMGLAGLLLNYGYYHHNKRRAAFFWTYFVILFGSLTLFIQQRLHYPQPPTPVKVAGLEAKKSEKKIILLGFEGLSFDFIIPLISQGKLPNFSWLAEGGSWGRLENFTPSEPLVWSHSLNTGKLPAKHRQISLYGYELWPMTEKIEVVPRFILFRQLTRTGLLKLTQAQKPSRVRDIWSIAAENGLTVLRQDWPYRFEPARPGPKTEKLFNSFFEGLQFEGAGPFKIAQHAFYRDSEYEDRAFQEKNQTQAQLYSLLLNGLDTVEVYFYKYSFPELFGNIDQEEITKYGAVIEKYYQFYDQIIGKYLASLKEEELLVVYSPHGNEPLPLWKRFVEWLLGNPQVSAYHENAPDGAIFLYGRGVIKERHVEGMKLVDIGPTLLYYLDLPIGKDMDGIVRSAIFTNEFTEENPILYISSYEDYDFKRQ